MKTNEKLDRHGLTMGLVSLLAGSLLAAEDKPAAEQESALMRFLTRDYMLGDWCGARTDLRERGVDFEFIYFGAVPNNLEGGLQSGSVYEGALLMSLDLYSDKLVGYEGGQFHVSSLWIHGEEFAQEYVGDLNKTSLLDFPDSFRLWELWYEQKFLDRKVSLKFGQLSIDRDFILPEFYHSLASINFLNQTFFYPTLAFNVYDIAGFPIGHHALASTPYGAPGVRLRVDPCEQFYAQAGVYDGLPDLKKTGTRINLNEEEGALAYFEIGYRLNQTKESTGLPGNFKLGAYLHTDEFFDNLSVFMGAPETHDNTYGVYFLADQVLFREIGKDDPAQQGLVGFFRVAAAPEDRNLTEFGIDGGLVYRGLIPTRDWDTLGVAGSYLEVSEDIQEGMKLAGFPVIADYEGVVELNYKAQMAAWWTVQASLQRVFHPGARTAGDIPDSWVLILQSVLRF